jgi:hypothetical protein
MEVEASGVSKSILEGLDDIPTVIRQVCRNVKRWRDAKMALRRTASGMCGPAMGFRCLKAHKQLPVLKAALPKHRAADATAIDQTARAA